MSILLMGATGFLGKRLTLKLDQKKIKYIPASLSLGVDFRDAYQFNKIFEVHKIDIILNAAAFVGGIQFGFNHTAEIGYNNSLINVNLFELAKIHGIKRIINPISNCSYPRDITSSFQEDHWWDGELDESVFVYGFVRKASYVQSWAYRKQYGLHTINLIVPNMYGPGDHFDEVRSHALGALVMKICDAKQHQMTKVVVWGSGKPIREWLYIDDFVDIMIEAMEIPYFDEPINVGVGKGISIYDLALMIKQTAQYPGDLILDPSKPDGAPYKIMDISRSKGIFKHLPSTSLESGIRETVNYYNNLKGYNLKRQNQRF